MSAAGPPPAGGAGPLDLSVVLLSYNTRELTEQALRTVFDASSGLRVEIFVVDNASRDQSAEMVSEQFPQVRLIRNDRNLGFSAGNNVALRLATGRYLLLLNTDTIVRQDTLRCLVEFMDAHPEAGAAGCKILNPDGSLQLDSRRGFPTPLAAFAKISGLSRLFPRHPRLARYNMTYLDPDQVAEVEVLSGSCMMVRRQTTEQVGLLDEGYFMYGEDIDWCYRMRAAGWRTYYVPHTEIVHFRGGSGRSEPLRVLYRKTRAMSIFVGKHMGHRYRFFPLGLLHLGIVLHGLVALAASLSRKLALPLVDGVLVLIGIRLGLALRYHPSLGPLIHRIETVSGQVGLEVHPTRWLTPPPYTDLEWAAVYGVSTAVWLLGFALLGLYDRHRLSALRAAVAVALGFAGVVTTVFFLKAYNFSRLAAAAAWACNTVLVAGWRLVARRLLQTARGRRLGRRRALVVGTDAAAEQFLVALQRLAVPGYEVVGLVGQVSSWRGQVVAGKQVLGVAEDLPRLLRDHQVDELIFTSGTVAHLLQQAVRGPRGKRLRVRLVPGTFAALVEGRSMASVDDLPLIEVNPRR